MEWLEQGSGWWNVVRRSEPNKDHGLVCGECTVLVDQFKATYGGHCSNYCAALGMTCVGAWEEANDSCFFLSAESCDHHFASGQTSDGIC